MLTTRQHQKEARSDAQRTDPTHVTYSPTRGRLMAGNGDDYRPIPPDRAIAEMRIELKYLRRDMERGFGDAADKQKAGEQRIQTLEGLLKGLEERVEPMATTYEERKKDRQQFSGTVLAGSAVAFVSIILTLLAPLLLRLIQGG